MQYLAETSTVPIFLGARYESASEKVIQLTFIIELVLVCFSLKKLITAIREHSKRV